MIFQFYVGFNSFCQDSTLKLNIDITQYDFLADLISRTFQMPFNHLYHSPEDEDRYNERKYGHLKNQQPTSNNYDNYYNLACSLWELEKLTAAEKMFLKIINSNEKHYSTTYYHSSDIPGDTTVNSYGYGSYTSSYKHNAAIYLTKIYIEQKKFDKALSFLKVAVKKYKVSYNCGTGFHRQQDEYNFLYGCIYEGQKKYYQVMDLLLPECLTRDDGIIVRTIQKLYSAKQITKKLKDAENSIKCEFDSLPSLTYQTIYSSNSKTEKTDTLIYYSGTASINLFGKLVQIPRPNLENGERITKERFLKEFRESSFYYNLSKHK